jgi:hypothetical protein
VVKTFFARLSIKEHETPEIVYVVNGLQDNLLSRRASKDLKLLNFNKELAAGEVIEDPLQKIWDPRERFPKCFDGLGKMKLTYKIKLRDNAQPYAISSPRRIAHPIRSQVKNQLDEMEKAGVISVVKEPTVWCAGMVPVPKPSDPTRIRICVDLIQLNKSIIREQIILPSVEETLSKFAGAKFFSKLDCRDSFWQVPLREESRLLTTFLTPWNRYCFNRLSMGLCSASEYFHNAHSGMLEHLPGDVVHIDDIAVFGSTQSQHDQHLHDVLSVLQDNGITLNKKCLFRVKSMPWVGYIVSEAGSEADPQKVQGITDLEPPTDKSGVKSLQARVQFLRKFVPNMADILAPITDLLRGI